MEQKKLVLSLIITAVALSGIYLLLIFLLNALPNSKGELSSAEIMEIIKTDKDYADLSTFITGFDPEVASYVKLGPEEYKTIKLQWQEQGFGDRIAMVDKVNLNDSTYWIELKDKNDETKGLRTIVDVKEKKSLLLIAALSIKAGIGI